MSQPLLIVVPATDSNPQAPVCLIVSVIRIIIAEMTASNYERTLAAVGAQSDMLIVDSARRRGTDLLIAARETRPDVVIIGLRDGALPGEATHLLGELPAVKVVGMAEHLDKAVVLELTPLTTSVPTPSPRELVETIREAVHRSAAATG